MIATLISGKVVLQSTRTTQVLAVDVDEWVAFIEQVKAGEFDSVLPDEPD